MQERTVNNRQSRISSELQEYINELVKEVVLNGKDFNSQKKWLKKYVEAEGGNYENIEKGVKLYIDNVGDYLINQNEELKQSMYTQGKKVWISQQTTNTIINKKTRKAHNNIHIESNSHPIKKSKTFLYLRIVAVVILLVGIFVWQINNYLELREQQTYQQLINKPNLTLTDVNTFLKTYPNSQYKLDVKKIKEELEVWKQLVDNSEAKAEDFMKFLAIYPQGYYVQKAKDRKRELENREKKIAENNIFRWITKEIGMYPYSKLNREEVLKLKRLDIKLHDFAENKIPKEIILLNDLTSLSVSYCRGMYEFPKEIIPLKKLRYLLLCSVDLNFISTDIKEMKSLDTLGLHKNKLDFIPKELFQLRNLKVLWLGDNNLHSIPKNVKQLNNLKYLALERNKLYSLPKEIGELSNLEELWLSGNNLTSLPKEIGKLKKLKRLFLENNKLNSLPKEFFQLTNLKTLALNGNYFSVEEIRLIRRSMPNCGINAYEMKHK